MQELYEKFKDDLIDIRLSEQIKTFSQEDLKIYLSSVTTEDKAIIRRYIKKQKTRNDVIVSIASELTEVHRDSDIIRNEVELNDLIDEKKLDEVLKNKTEILRSYEGFEKLCKAIDDGDLNSYLISCGYSPIEKLNMELPNVTLLYMQGISLSQIHNYIMKFAGYQVQMMSYYNDNLGEAYLEEYEEDVIKFQNLIIGYRLAADLDELKEGSININDYLESKYSFSQETQNKFTELIRLSIQIKSMIEVIQKKIEESLFDIDHSKLLKEYVKVNLISFRDILNNYKKLFKDRSINSQNLLMNLKEVESQVDEVIENYRAINEIEVNYLPKIRAQSSALLEDVKSYYNYSIRKNIERRTGEYGFSKKITQEEIENIVKIIEDKLYKLTTDQLKAIYKGAEFLNYPYTTNCLLQGDVSSGKTIVSVALMFILAQKGYRSAYIVPRKSLRIQHFNTLKKYNELFGFNFKIVDSQAESSIKDADIILNGYSFNKQMFNDTCIDMAFVDEIQLLGVKQRNSIQEQYENIDMFYTTATPHPRTKTISLIGNMDVIEIRQLPPGRKAKITKPFIDSGEFISENRTLIEEVFNKGEMMIVVCPLANVDNGDISNVHTAYEYFKCEFPDVNIVKLLSSESDQPSKNKAGISAMDEKLGACSNGEVNILVTTKIIEVGVDIPCASIMVITHPRGGFSFGVSSLHQLRGRVGRGQQQAYCFIQTSDNGYEKGSAIDTVIETEDVFEITEKDLDWRGIDRIIGLNQTSKSGSKKNTIQLVEEYKYIADKVKTAIVSLDDKMFDALCQEVDTSKKLKDLN